MKFYVANNKKRKQVYDILNIFYDHDDLVFDEEAGLKVYGEEIIFGEVKTPYEDNDLKRKLYELLVKDTGYRSPWGYLTGSKPSKLLGKMSPIDLKEKYFLSDKKLKLLEDIRNLQESMSFDPDDFSLYINIPFCPTRCKYCSYPTIVGDRKEKSEYISSLIYEIENINLPQRLDAIYIGGGTPSFIDEDDLARLLSAINKKFSYKPYYLYRQKNIVSNLENVGYERGGTSQRYNIIINEEKESIIGLGMNANTKLMNGKKFRNSRNLRDYFAKVQEEIRAKNEMINEYNINKHRRNYGN